MGILRRNIGNNLSRLRKDCGWTQAHLAEVSQISLRQVAAIEQSESYPTEGTLEKLASALGVSVMRFFEAPEFAREPTIPEALGRLASEFGMRVVFKRKSRDSV